MKKNLSKLFFAIMFVATTSLCAQAPNAFNYQAVLRSANGNLITGQLVEMRFTVRNNSAGGAIQYRETQNLTPNEFGLVDHAIGTGTVVSGTFAGITWANGTKFLQVELNTGGGFVDLGAEKLNSVPFALYSNNPGPAGPQGPAGATGPAGPAGSANISGTTNRLIKFTGATSGGNSQIFDNGTSVAINSTTPIAAEKLFVQDANLRVRFKSTNTASSTATQLLFDNTAVFPNQTGSIGFRGGDGGWGGYLYLNVDGVDKFRIFANGSMCSQTSISICSDQRFKKNFEPLVNVVDKLKRLNGIYFDWRTDEFKDKGFVEGRQIGLIAQDVEKVYPELVIAIEDGYKSVDYTMLTAVLVEAIKEQQAQIDELKTENASLKTELESSNSDNASMKMEMQNRLEAIENQLGIGFHGQK